MKKTEIKDGWLISCCEDKVHFLVPDGVTNIWDGAFKDCCKLRDVVIPDSVKTIGRFAFWTCSSLTEVSLPERMEEIKESAFHSCAGIESICIPEGLKMISRFTFYGCSGLKSIVIPAGVKMVDKYAFCECSGLTEVTLPDGLQVIGEGAFEDCTALERINIPKSLKRIDRDAFSGCGSLNAEVLAEIGKFGDVVYVQDRMEFMSEAPYPEGPEPGSYRYGDFQYYLNENGTAEIERYRGPEDKLQVPEELDGHPVIRIGDRAFKNRWRLKNIVIPDSVKTIGDRTFRDCISLTDITLPKRMSVIGPGAFRHCERLKSISIPDGIDAIFGGHNETLLIAEMINGIAVAKSDFYGNELSHISITFDRDGKKVTGSSIENINVADVAAGLNGDEAVAGIVAEYAVEADRIFEEKIGEASEDCEVDYFYECSISNWFSNAVKDATGADMAFINPSGIFESVPAGEINLRKLYQMSPFENELVVAEISGAQLRELWETTLETERMPQYGTLAFAGLYITYDSAAEDGSKVKSLSLPDGTEIKDEDVFTVATLDFLAGGGNDYTMLPTLTWTGTAIMMRDAYAVSLRNMGTLTAETIGWMTDISK